MKDFLKQEIQVGATVLTTDKNYNELRRAKVIKLTPKMVILELIQGPGHYDKAGDEFKRFPYQVAVIDKIVNL